MEFLKNNMKSVHNLVFPGQGSQRPGMGADFFENFPGAKAVFERASAALGEDLGAICFSENEKLDLTEYTQPCILTCSIAMLETLRNELPLEAAFFAGHSLGEYTALVAAGVFQLEDAVKIVRKRGALMQRAVPAGEGAMAALIAEDLQNLPYQELVLASGAEIANVNSAEQTVISGQKVNVEKAVAALEEKLPQIQVIFLNVSAPFHSSLMKPAESEFREYITGFSPSINFTPAGRVASNVSGTLHNESTLIDNLVAQIGAPVHWLENMRLLIETKNPILEIGPNKTLSRFFGAEGVKIKSVTNLRSMQAFCAPETV